MANNTEIIEVLSEVKKYDDTFSCKKAIVNQDGNIKEVTFIIESNRKSGLKKIKPGFKYQGDYWND